MTTSTMSQGTPLWCIHRYNGSWTGSLVVGWAEVRSLRPHWAPIVLPPNSMVAVWLHSAASYHMTLQECQEALRAKVGDELTAQGLLGGTGG